MFEKRVIPCLQLLNESLVKTQKFKKYNYIGDPINTCKIFNELEVDEMIILDIRASLEHRNPNYDILKQLSAECFMPLAYGGGLYEFEQVKKILSMGFEKVILNSVIFDNPALIEKIVSVYGSQSVIASVDIKKNFFSKYKVYSVSGKKRKNVDVFDWIKRLQDYGVGEIMITDIDREGTWRGYNYDLISQVTQNCKVPVIAHGGAGSKNDIEKVINESGAYAAAIGNMCVFQGKDLGVLINYQHNYRLGV